MVIMAEGHRIIGRMQIVNKPYNCKKQGVLQQPLAFCIEIIQIVII